MSAVMRRTVRAAFFGACALILIVQGFVALGAFWGDVIDQRDPTDRIDLDWSGDAFHELRYEYGLGNADLYVRDVFLEAIAACSDLR